MINLKFFTKEESVFQWLNLKCQSKIIKYSEVIILFLIFLKCDALNELLSNDPVILSKTNLGNIKSFLGMF